MAIPTVYTEKTLAEYMLTRLGSLSDLITITLGDTDAGDLTEVVNDVMLALGVTNLASLTGAENIRRVRALAKVAVWQYVVANFASVYDFTADGETYKRSQLFRQAMEYLAQSTSEWLTLQDSLSDVYVIRVLSARYVQDPYRIEDREENEA